MGLAVAMLPPTEATFRICESERSQPSLTPDRAETHLLASKVAKLRADRVEGTSKLRLERRRDLLAQVLEFGEREVGAKLESSFRRSGRRECEELLDVGDEDRDGVLCGLELDFDLDLGRTSNKLRVRVRRLDIEELFERRRSEPLPFAVAVLKRPRYIFREARREDELGSRRVGLEAESRKGLGRGGRGVCSATDLAAVDAATAFRRRGLRTSRRSPAHRSGKLVDRRNGSFESGRSC